MLGGTVTMTGCMFWELNLFAIEVRNDSAV
jgi:hypothetical protein